jgi:hypothetical protein
MAVILTAGLVLLGQGQGQEGMEGAVACPQYCLEVD